MFLYKRSVPFMMIKDQITGKNLQALLVCFERGGRGGYG